MKTLRLKQTIVFVSVSMWMCACSSNNAISQSIAASVERGSGTTIKLADHAPFGWDKVCIFGPYTTEKSIDEITEIREAAARSQGIDRNDRIDLLMFIEGNRIVASIAHLRYEGDFDKEVLGKCYRREQAMFRVASPDADGWVVIGRP